MSAASGLHVGKTADGWLIRLEGKGTLIESASFCDLVGEQLQEPGVRVCVDLSDCQYLDSTFLGCLVKLNTAQQGSDPPRFAVFAPSEARQRLLHALHLDQLLVFADALPQVLGESIYVPFAVPTREHLGDLVADAHRRLSELGGPEAEQFARIANSVEDRKSEKE